MAQQSINSVYTLWVAQEMFSDDAHLCLDNDNRCCLPPDQYQVLGQFSIVDDESGEVIAQSMVSVVVPADIAMETMERYQKVGLWAIWFELNTSVSFKFDQVPQRAEYLYWVNESDIRQGRLFLDDDHHIPLSKVSILQWRTCIDERTGEITRQALVCANSTPTTVHLATEHFSMFPLWAKWFAIQKQAPPIQK